MIWYVVIWYILHIQYYIANFASFSPDHLAHQSISCFCQSINQIPQINRALHLAMWNQIKESIYPIKKGHWAIHSHSMVSCFPKLLGNAFENWRDVNKSNLRRNGGDLELWSLFFMTNFKIWNILTLIMSTTADGSKSWMPMQSLQNIIGMECSKSNWILFKKTHLISYCSCPCHVAEGRK